MKIKTALFIFITIIVFVFNCGKSDETYTVEMKDGVRHVHNRASLWGDEPKVALEFVQKIGVLEGKDENYLLYKPHDVVVDKENNIYILDQGNFRIQKFNKNGIYLATIGGKGQGPGEFMFPFCIEIDSEDNLYIGDLSAGSKILVLTSDGKEIKRIKIIGSPENFCSTHAGNILVQTQSSTRLESNLISLLDKDGNLIKGFGVIKEYRDKNLTNLGNNVEMRVDNNDNIYVAFYEQNRIEKYSTEGELIFRVDRPLNYELGVNEESSIVLPPELQGGRTITLTIFSLASKNIDIDHRNRIWVQTYKKQKEEGDKPGDYFELEIYNDDGILLGKLPIPENFNNMRIFNDRLYLIDRNEEMCIYEYKIVEK